MSIGHNYSGLWVVFFILRNNSDYLKSVTTENLAISAELKVF